MRQAKYKHVESTLTKKQFILLESGKRLKQWNITIQYWLVIILSSLSSLLVRKRDSQFYFLALDELFFSARSKFSKSYHSVIGLISQTSLSVNSNNTNNSIPDQIDTHKTSILHHTKCNQQWPQIKDNKTPHQE